MRVRSLKVARRCVYNIEERRADIYCHSTMRGCNVRGCLWIQEQRERERELRVVLYFLSTIFRVCDHAYIIYILCAWQARFCIDNCVCNARCTCHYLVYCYTLSLFISNLLIYSLAELLATRAAEYRLISLIAMTRETVAMTPYRAQLIYHGFSKTSTAPVNAPPNLAVCAYLYVH